MITLIRKVLADPKNRYSSNIETWLINNRFKIMVYDDDDLNGRCTFFLVDETHKIHSLKLIPMVGKNLKLFEQPEIKLTPSIDTCGIGAPQLRRDEIFKLIENYLLNPDNVAALEFSNFHRLAGKDEASGNLT